MAPCGGRSSLGDKLLGAQGQPRVPQHVLYGQAVNGIQAHGFAQQVAGGSLNVGGNHERARLDFLQQLRHVVCQTKQKKREMKHKVISLVFYYVLLFVVCFRRLFSLALVFLLPSSKGRRPASSAYKITPHDHASTSGPA
jgi:hypothetical protein